MEAKEYIRERERMLNAYGRTKGFCSNVSCSNCPLCVKGSVYCDTEEGVDIVEAWSKEHPRKTYLDVLLEAFPNVPLNEVDGSPHFCPINIGLEEHVDADACAYTDCLNCWHREYKGGV